MKHILAALALSAAVVTGPALATYSPDAALSLRQVPAFGTGEELNLILQVPVAVQDVKLQQLALASGCEDFWYSASGWQWIAELFVNRC